MFIIVNAKGQFWTGYGTRFASEYPDAHQMGHLGIARATALALKQRTNAVQTLYQDYGLLTERVVVTYSPLDKPVGV